ncbi:hypothetical protein LBMAG42_16900 [Deltaproteobacteria bacterium]|nr:hypothetical protein LBMAG42_16900 [Deltaproteobacteria bacterium]
MKPNLLALAALSLSTGCLFGDSDNGQYVYQSYCQSCHGVDGSGGIDVGIGPDTGYYATGGSGFSANLKVRVPQLTDEAILKVLRDGYKGMPSQFSEDDDQALDVLSYMRDTFE